MNGNEDIWVFLSHSNKDYEKVRIVRNLLEDQHFRPIMFFLCCMEDHKEELDEFFCCSFLVGVFCCFCGDGQSADAGTFSRILEHKTDYLALVDYMLDDVRRNEFPALSVRAPFQADTPCEVVWETLRSCARPPMPFVSIFRFLRIAPPSEKPYVDHWTVGHYMDMEGLHFLDCSLEAGALYCLPYANKPSSCFYVHHRLHRLIR